MHEQISLPFEPGPEALPPAAGEELPSSPMGPDLGPEPGTDVPEASSIPGEAVGSIEVTADILVTALEMQAQLTRQRALAEQEAAQAKARENLDVLLGGFRDKAAERPEYYRDSTLNRYEKGRREREKADIEAENSERRAHGEPELDIPQYGIQRDYAAYGKNRWGIAALEGVAFGPGSDSPLDPKNRREHRKARNAARIASDNLGTRMAKEEFERDPRKTEDDKRRGGGRHGGVAINPLTGKSRFRDDDPELRNRSKIERKMIKGSEKMYKNVARKHRDQEHYLRNQGENYFVRNNTWQHIKEGRTVAAIRLAARGARTAGKGLKRAGSNVAQLRNIPSAYRDGKNSAARIDSVAYKLGKVYGRAKAKRSSK